MSGIDRVGFMQGRLSSMVSGRIQAFPADHWRAEFPVAARHGFRLVEWTLDHDGLHANPLMTSDGQAEIKALCAGHGLSIPSLTGDCFMQAPFWKATGADRAAYQADFLAVVEACGRLGIGLIVVPVVDNGAIDESGQEDVLVDFLLSQRRALQRARVRVGVEANLGPTAFASLMARLPDDAFGVNYDIGNSAALGFDPAEELEAYGARVLNVHVKDRPRGGTTVPLGRGAADFAATFNALSKANYRGNYILQTARAVDGDHEGDLVKYRDMTVAWLNAHGA